MQPSNIDDAIKYHSKKRNTKNAAMINSNHEKKNIEYFDTRFCIYFVHWNSSSI